MQSSLVASATRSPWARSLAHNQAFLRGLSSASAGRTADLAIHSGEVEAGPDVYYRKNELMLSLSLSPSLSPCLERENLLRDTDM